MKLFLCQRFLLTIQSGFWGVIHGHAFTAEVVDLFLEIINRHKTKTGFINNSPEKKIWRNIPQ